MRDGFLIKDIDNVVDTQHMRAAVDPVLEEKILDLGGDIMVQKDDNDALHLQIHGQAQGKDRDPLRRARRLKHNQEHEAQIVRKAAEVRQIQMQMQVVQAAGQGGGGQGGQPSAGNTAQIPASANAPDLERGMKIGT
jgi:hypothetical protein